MSETATKPEPACMVRVPADVHAQLVEFKERTGVPICRTVADGMTAYFAAIERARKAVQS